LLDIGIGGGLALAEAKSGFFFGGGGGAFLNVAALSFVPTVPTDGLAGSSARGGEALLEVLENLPAFSVKPYF
jgi:hypothetical protein